MKNSAQDRSGMLGMQHSSREIALPKAPIFTSGRKFRLGIMLLLLAVMALSTVSSAQNATAKIVGTVTDPQGLVVPGVKVTVTNLATNVATETTTDKGGFYQALNLPIGTYKVAAVHEGFRPIEQTTAPLEINQSLRVDLKLEVGSIKEVMVVEGQAEGVETINPTVGQSVTSRPILNLPLNGRDVLDLALLQPGVSESNPDDGGGQGFNIGGGRSDSVTFLLDGGLNNDLLGNEVVLDPNPDSVAEFRILTSNYTAEYGRSGAGVISVVTKSGTNQIHGSAYDYARNTDFDANSYFNKNEIANPVTLPRNDLKRHQFGATLGGPIEIPHLVNGKDRFFFFLAYQGQRQTRTLVEPQIATFTPAELNGDFSAAPDAANIISFLNKYPYFVPAGGSPSNAIIDPTKFDPATINYLNFFKTSVPGGFPTSTTISPSTGIAEITQSAKDVDNNYELTTKFDLNFTSKDKLSVTLGGSRSHEDYPFGAYVIGFPEVEHNNNYFSNIAYTRTFTPTLLNEFRATAQRTNGAFGFPTGKTVTPSQLGFGIATDLSPGFLPQMEFDNGLEFGTDGQGPAVEISNTFAYADTLTWVKGRNTWKFGAGFSNFQNNTVYDFYGNGEYYFSSTGGNGTGDSLADFLVGIPENFFQGPNAPNNIRSKATYGYAQDEWRALKNLTLTLGLRYEYSTPKLDTQGRTFTVIPGEQSTRFPLSPLGLVFPGDQNSPRGVNFPQKKNFGPRIGFAWSPGSSSKTSLRGGFGIFYDILKGEDNLQFNGAPPFYSEQEAFYGKPTSGPPFTYYSEPWTTGGFTANPFPSVPPTASTAFALTPEDAAYPFGSGGIYYVNPHIKTPYTYQYNLSLQRELTRNLVAEVNYVGSSSKGLTSLIDSNPFDLSTVGGSKANYARILNETQNSDITAYCKSLAKSWGEPSGPSICPYTNLSEFSNVAFANFSSLEASLTKQNGENRIFGNTYFTLGYTYGHSIDNASGFRNRSSQVPYYLPGQFRSSSDFDLTHRITFSGGWDLPFDKAWASGPKRLIQGWSLYPIFSWRTGFPLTVFSAELYDDWDPGDPGPSGAGDGYLANAVFASGYNSITILNPKTHGNMYFNPATFVNLPDKYNPSDPYGLPRNFFRGPRRTNLDLTVAKATRITERLNSEFRVDAFNLLNHTEFASPDIWMDEPEFGQITSTDTGKFGAHTERELQIALRLTF